MENKNNATCAICGKGYYMCLSCKDMTKLHPWKMHTDTSEHYKIYQILRGYNTKVYSKEEARLKLQMVDLSDFDNLRDNIKNIINDIMDTKGEVNQMIVEPENAQQLAGYEEDKIPNYDDSDNEKARMTRKRKSFKVVETE